MEKLFWLDVVLELYEHHWASSNLED